MIVLLSGAIGFSNSSNSRVFWQLTWVIFNTAKRAAEAPVRLIILRL